MNTDSSERVVIHTSELDWQASPSPSVWRKRVELRGPQEAGRVTSVVRYEPDSRFSSHGHPQGEEILVLDGVFSDEHGDYPAGSFLLNPEGFRHAPYSTGGCRLFVKLRQYPGITRTQLLLHADGISWRPGDLERVSEALLYKEAGFPEHIRLLRLDPGAVVQLSCSGGVEIFVLDGELFDGTEKLLEGSWGRYLSNGQLRLESNTGALCYLKAGHLGSD